VFAEGLLCNQQTRSKRPRELKNELTLLTAKIIPITPGAKPSIPTTNSV